MLCDLYLQSDVLLFEVRDQAIFIGSMGPVQNAMGRTLFLFAFKHGADTFSPSLGMGPILF